jgi:imidazolonepropionase-like amidohydrolase
MNGASAADVGLRELAKKTAIAAPDVLAAGYILRPSLAPDVFLLNPAFWELERGLNSVDRVRQAVKMNLGHGVDWIKMLVTEGIGGDPTKLQFTETEVVAAVEEARRSEIPVQAHAFSDEGVRIALKLESALSNTAALYQKKPWT